MDEVTRIENSRIDAATAKAVVDMTGCGLTLMEISLAKNIPLEILNRWRFHPQTPDEEVFVSEMRRAEKIQASTIMDEALVHGRSCVKGGVDAAAASTFATIAQKRAAALDPRKWGTTSTVINRVEMDGEAEKDRKVLEHVVSQSTEEDLQASKRIYKAYLEQQKKARESP